MRDTCAYYFAITLYYTFPKKKRPNIKIIAPYRCNYFKIVSIFVFYLVRLSIFLIFIYFCIERCNTEILVVLRAVIKFVIFGVILVRNYVVY